MTNKTTTASIALFLAAVSVSAIAQGPDNGNQNKSNQHKTPHKHSQTDPYVVKHSGGSFNGSGGGRPHGQIMTTPGHQLTATPRGNPAPERPAANYTFHNLGDSNRQYNRDAAHFTLQIHDTVVNNHFYQNPAWGGHWRDGYVPQPGLSLSFNVGLYAFTPFGRPVFPSPYYYYPGVPAYVPVNRVYVVPGYGVDWNMGAYYAYRPGVAYGSYGYHTLNHAVDDILQVFQNQNIGAVDDLLGDNQVAVFAEGKYEYSLSAPDFHSMMSDNAQATHTTNFTITNVRRDDEFAVVQAAHQFQNADGTSDTVYQQYRLLNDGYRYVITDFMTSHTPFAGQPSNNF